MQKTLLLVFGLFNFALTIQAQQDPLLAFSAYGELPREQCYLHLNKTVFLQGESLAYKAYVLDKGNRLPSTETRNLYVTVETMAGTRVKGMLIRVDEGTARGVIDIDSLIKPGAYRLRAYTNWMRNFSEPNHYEQQILVVDPTRTETTVTSGTQGAEQSAPASRNQEVILPPDLALLPEGGYAPLGVETVFGVIAKAPDGYGIPNLSGQIIDESGGFLTQFRLNQRGLGSFILKPEEGKSYSAVIEYQGQTYKYPVGYVRPTGPGIRLQHLGQRVGLIFQASKSDIGSYQLTIHNGTQIKGVPLDFTGSDKVIKVLEKSDLYPGINVFTVFDSAGNPLLERLYYNDLGDEPVAKGPEIEVGRSVADSVELIVSLPPDITANWHSLSLAIHPETIRAANSNHNFLSYTRLVPYLRGTVQDAHYYFIDPTPSKWYELDLVLLTQGWSSYSWTEVQSKAPQALFDFEKGISILARETAEEGGEYFLFPTALHSGQFLERDQGPYSLRMDEFYPITDEKISLSQIDRKGKLSKPGLTLQFKPAGIPTPPHTTIPSLPDRWLRSPQREDLISMDLAAMQNLIALEEVVVEQKTKEERIERLRNRTIGSVDYFKPDDPRRNNFLANYLSGRGYIVNESFGEFSIRARNPQSPNNATPAIFLDDVLLTNYANILYRFRMDLIDYIVINSSGIGGGLRFGGGVIRIYTLPGTRIGSVGGFDQTQTSYSLPLSFSDQKQYYTPRYPSLTSSLFLKYGILAWVADLKLNKDGVFRIKVPRSGSDYIRCDLQGWLNPTQQVSYQWTVQQP